ncbi:hypothetical protein BB450_07700 [Helicobacter pylori]|nr:hypothetical protein [Helicobacter pylori]PDW30574.1 hypothetical protein BB450_07700 [Helicobacter pylori]
MFFQSCFLSDFIIDCLFLFRGLFFILYSLFFILYSLFFILYSLFLTLQDDFYGLKIIKGER